MPWSSLFFSPTQTCRSLRAVRFPAVRIEDAGHVPMACQGFPPAKFTAAEFADFAVEPVGAEVFRNRLGGVAVVPCR